MLVILDNISIEKGQKGKIHIISKLIEPYDQAQIDIFDTGKLNPTSKLGFSSKPIKRIGDAYIVEFDTENLECGIYEIKIVRLHTPKSKSTEKKRIDFVGGENFQRVFFEVSIKKNERIIEKDLKNLTFKIEHENEKHFYSGIDISKSGNVENYAVFVLIKGLKIGLRYRLDKFEILPTDKGLDSIDKLNYTNDFLKYRTSTNFVFLYDDETKTKSHNENPVTFAHFPKIYSDNIDNVRQFVSEKVQFLLQAFSLTRNASGEIFDIIIIKLGSNEAYRYSISNPYKGNLIIGRMAGENAESLGLYIRNMEANSFNSLLVNLHKETLKEKNGGFMILRYWNILETLAENKNYCRNDNLLDHDDNFIYEINKNGDSIIQKISGPLNIVYNLVRKSLYPQTKESYEQIKMWYAVRNCIAHFGTISSYSKLNSPRDRKYAEKAYKIIKTRNDYSPILFSLKETTRILLMKELNKEVKTTHQS